MLRNFKTLNWWHFIKAILGGLIIWIVFAMGSIYVYSVQSDTSPADAVIVLGAAAWNGQPSPVFEERIKHAINLYQNHKVRILIFTGGIGENELLAESEVAREYAIQRGVDDKDIFCEIISKTTYQNLQEAKVIIDREHIGRVLIVSDPLHMKRAITIARDIGIEAYPSPTPTTRYISLQNQFYFLLRETYYYTIYLLRRGIGVELK